MPKKFNLFPNFGKMMYQISQGIDPFQPPSIKKVPQSFLQPRTKKFKATSTGRKKK